MFALGLGLGLCNGSGTRAPSVAEGTAKTLPDPNATETDVVVTGFTVNAQIQPRGRPCTWQVEYGATTSYGTTTAARALPGRLAAYYQETWSLTSLAGCRGGITRDRLTHQATEGGFARYTAEGNSGGDDGNHIDGIGWIQLPMYFYCGFEDPTDAARARLGGGDPDFRNAVFSMRLRGNSWVKEGTRLCTWIQADEDTTRSYKADIRRPNWCHTAVDHTASVEVGDWVDVEWTLRNRTQDWTYAGRNELHTPVFPRYWYGELDKTLSNVNVDIFPLQNIDIQWAVVYPSGSIDFDDMTITYRQHNLCASSNGGTLISSPAGSTGTGYLTDGWRNGAGREWQSAASPTNPQDLVYQFADPVQIKKIQIHNSTVNPSENIEVAVSEDGSSWTTISTGTLPESSADGPNFVFHFDENQDVDTIFQPMHAGSVSYMRVRITSGYQAGAWGLGEIEAFGTGATEETDDAWYDVNQDIEVAAGTYHYRVVATTDQGTVYGPDQTVVVP
jgi:hypothetical protein